MSSARTASSSPSAARGATLTAAGVPASVRYVAIGASDSVGAGARDPASGSWPARIASLLPAGSAYVNLGVSGSLASDARAAQVPRAIAQRPTVISLWLAVNDVNAQIAPVTYAQTLGGIIDALARGTEARIFVGNVPDLRPVPAYTGVDKTRLLAAIEAYNSAIAQVVSRSGGRAVLVDLFTGSAALVSDATVSSDGFHPSDAGYQLIADRFTATMRASGVPLRVSP